MLGISYRRLSTSNQVYGLDAQKAEIEMFAASNGIELINDFSDIQTGKNAERDGLRLAIDYAKATGSKLIVSKLDRLTRSLSDLQEIINSGVELVIVQFGLNCPSILLNLMGSISQFERELISRRTKDALTEAKRQGVKLGNPKISEARAEAIKANRRRGLESAKKYEDVINILRGQGLSYEKTASKMNAMGLRTTRGSLFKANTVRRLALRLT